MSLSSRVWSFASRIALVAAVFCGATATASAQAHYEGVAGPGALYEIDVPANWNGDLVLYAHGIVQASLPVTLPTTEDGFDIFRSHLLASGYAVNRSEARLTNSSPQAMRGSRSITTSRACFPAPHSTCRRAPSISRRSTPAARTRCS